MHHEDCRRRIRLSCWSLFFNHVSAARNSCESLASLALPDTTVTLAQTLAPLDSGGTCPNRSLAPGTHYERAVSATGRLKAVAPNDLPAFCRVVLSMSLQ